ncbi:hypothetical protein Clacol_008208 [Clathrus columnatus]|uniref:Trafficking protein particle complex subunit n=1 Tax=Clathrus columnatus TaxID=1419009 RepID=A0AAV5AH32_9AGAM|nr:hypothetical protein Clacol_008208 [Clathrus columnatus]
MQSHPRFSAASLDQPASSTASTSTRFSLPAPSLAASFNTQSKSGPRSSIYDRPLNKTRTLEISLSAFSFLFSEIIQYTQKRVNGIEDLERTRYLELLSWRSESLTKVPKREVRFLPAIMMIHTQLWRAIFGKPADAIERSVENSDEYMLVDNEPPITRFISVPRDMSSLSCSAITAGIVEAVLDGLGFPARVTAHPVPTDVYPYRTTILIKFQKEVLEREEALK